MLDSLYRIASQDESLAHPFTTLVATLPPWSGLWPQMRRFLAPVVGSYPAAFGALYTRLSGEERETLRLVHESLHAPDSPRRLLYQELGVDPAVPLDDLTLPGFIRNWCDWWAVSATVKPLPEALGAFAVAFPVIENAFFGQLRHHEELFRAFLLDTEKHRKHWEAVMLSYTARLDLIGQGTRQALRQWQAVQDQLISFVTTHSDKDSL